MTTSNTQPHVLLCDDDQFLLEMYANKFQAKGFTTEQAQSGAEALEKLKTSETPFAVAMLDVVMPEMGGFDLVQTVREKKLATDTIFIFLSNMSQEEDFKRAQELGVEYYIVKANHTPSEVVERVEQILAAKPTS